VRQHPTEASSSRRLADAYAEQGFVEEAVAQYLALLKHNPSDDEARARVSELVARKMPSWLPPEAADVAPFDTAASSLKLADPKVTKTPIICRFLRTTEAFAAPQGEGRDRVHGWAFPLVDYGYVWDGGTGRWVMRARVHRSAAVGSPMADDALLAVLSLYAVAREYLFCDPTRQGGEPVDLWLAVDGQPGAKAVGRNLYLYAVGVPRTGGEWLREVAHEYGHMALPGVNGFTRSDDPWADGQLGELLFAKWLAGNGEGAVSSQSLPIRDAEATARARREALISQARGRPDLRRLEGADYRARDYFLGLALRVEAAAGPRFLGEALLRSPRGSAAHFVWAAEGLAKERGTTLW